MIPSPHIMVVEPYAGGHQGYYLECLLRRWSRCTSGGRITVVVGHAFRRWHSDTTAWIETLRRDIRLLEADFSEPSKGGTWSLIESDLHRGRVLEQLVQEIRPDEVVLMYLDHFQFSLAIRVRFDFQVKIRGILFRPSFHYGGELERIHSRPKRLDAWLRRSLFKAACRNPHLVTVFSLDPFLPESESVINVGCRLVHLPEPSPARTEAAIQPDSNAVLLLGSLTRLKGLPEFMHAVELIPESTRQSGRFVLAGPIADNLYESFATWRASISPTCAELNVSNHFLTDAEIEGHVARSGVVVLPYQGHVGMSNVLVRAAGHGKPVIGPRQGLLGGLIRRHGLGCTVDTFNPKEICDAITDFLTSGRVSGFNENSARSFAELNTDDRFADVILQSISKSN